MTWQEDFDKRMNEHHERFHLMGKFMTTFFVIALVSFLGMMGFSVWVVITLLTHYGVI